MSLTGNITKLYAFSALKMALFPMAIITLFWKDQVGLSLTEILLLQGLFSAVTMVMEYPSGYVSDRLGYRFSLNLACLLGLIGWLLYLPASSFGEVLLAEAFLGAAFAFISGADSALLYETLRQAGEEHRYSHFDGRMTGFAQTGEAAGALFAGTLYAYWPLLPFAIQVVVWLLALLLARSLTEPPRPATRIASHRQEALQTVRLALFDNRKIRYTILMTTVLGLASFFPVWLIQPLMQERGVPLSWFGPVWAVANLTVAFFSWISDRVHYRLGTTTLVWLWLLLVLSGYLGLSLCQATWGFAFYFLLTATRGLQAPVLRHMLQSEAPSSRRASILSLKSFVFRLLFILTGPLVGWCADHHGLATTLHVTGWLLFFVLLLIAARFLRVCTLKATPEP